MSVAARFKDSKAYDSGYKVGVEGHKRLHTAYKNKFLKPKKNQTWARPTKAEGS